MNYSFPLLVVYAWLVLGGRFAVAAAPASLKPTAGSPAPAPSVVWHSSTRFLTRETTVEMRFSTPMVQVWGATVEVDPASANAPLTATPPLRGTWAWRSSESGVFVPMEEPVRGRAYTFSVRGGLVDASGIPLPAPQPTLALKSAGLMLVARHPSWFSSQDTPRSPQLILQFNDKVNAAGAARAIGFVNDDGIKVRAAVKVATFGDLPRGYDLPTSFRQRALAVAGAPTDGSAPAADRALPGTLLVSPAEPLPLGKGWRLLVTGLPSADGKSRVEEAPPVNIGNIEPLRVSMSSANNEAGTAKNISVHFSKPLDAGETAEDVLSRLSLDPTPPGFKATYEKESLRITGDFTHEIPYQLKIDPGLKAADGLSMDAIYQESFVFKVLQPAVALPALSVSQMSKGRAVFDVHTINLSGVKIRVKVADRDSLIYALRAYRQYVDPDRGESDESDGSHGRIPFDAMPGQKIYEQEFTAKSALDDQDEFVVDWRQALNGRKAGAVFITVEGEARPEWTGDERRFGAQAFVQLTDLGMAWKLTTEEVFLCVFSQATGQPMEGVTLTVYDAEKNQLTRVATAEDGTARLPRKQASWLLAETADDLHAIELDGRSAEGLGMWRFGVPYAWDPPRGITRHVSIFTERPVYLPGHTVYFKAVSRLTDASGIKGPDAPEAAVLKAYDAKGRIFHQRDVQFSGTGSLDGTLELPEDVLGYYRLEIEMSRRSADAAAISDEDAPSEEEESEEGEGASRRDGPDVFTASFLVEEYKPNTFQITFDDSSFKLDGEKASLALQSGYLLGKPLAKAKLAWTATVSRGGFAPKAFPEFDFLDSRQTYYWDEEGYHDVPGEVVETDMVTGQARTDLTDDGRASLEFVIPEAPFPSLPRDVLVSAEVTDLNQQTITENWRRTLHASAFYLGIGRLEGISGAGQPVDIPVAAVRSDGEPWPVPVEARITVEKLNFTTVRVQTVGGGSNVKSDAQRGVVAEGVVRVLPKGQDTRPFTWIPKEPGFYYVTAKSTDPDGRKVESVTSVQIHGNGWATWQEREGVQISLSADKTSYADGETAKILVKSPVAGRALVTLERRNVIRHFFTEIKGNAQIVEVPVEAAMAPNVFVSVFIMRGAESSPRQHRSPDYKVGFVQLSISDSQSRLVVEAAPGQPSYRPGDEGTATATVRDGNGVPVAGAEVTFWAADDGVLSLRAYSPPDLWSDFHRPQPLAVITGTSLMNLLAEDPAELAFTNKGYVIGGGDAGDNAGNERLRRNFQPVAFFRGAMTTDADGRVSTSFSVPDNLTRFRLVAVAAAGADRFGTGEGSFEVNKPLMLDPALPRFATVGDEITAKGILLNNTDQAMEAEVSLTLDGLATTSQPLVKRITLAPRGSEAVAFPLRFQAPGTAVWQWKATSLTAGLNLADSVQSTLPVSYAQPVLREVHFASLGKTSDPVDLLAGANPELLQGMGQVIVSVSNSSLLETAGAVSHLLQYPYGCAEQTTSSTIPWLAMHQLGEAVPWVKKTPEEVRHAIQLGVNRLLSMQTSEGGLAYWPGGKQPELWASSYGGMGLALARDAGAVIPIERLTQLAAFLSNSLRLSGVTDDPAILYDRAFACYTLALLGKAEPAYHEVIARKAGRLPHPVRAMLALAILQSGGPSEAAIKVLDAPIDASLESWNHSLVNSRLTALNLLVWEKLDPAHAVTVSLTDRLLRERNSAGHWGSTYENGWALLALAEGARGKNQDLPTSTIDISFAGKTTTLTLPNQPATRSVTLPFDGLASTRSLMVTVSPASPLRAVATVEARPQLVPLLPRTQGFSISRNYAKVAPDGSTSPAENLEIGDLVAVTLDLNISEERRYIAVDDPLPAILEAINPKFTSQARPNASPAAAGSDLIHPWWSSHEELRHDRALFFADALWSTGKYRLSYLTRVVAEGTVTAPPAKIEAMYEPEQYGLSGTQRLSAQAAIGKVAEKK